LVPGTFQKFLRTHKCNIALKARILLQLAQVLEYLHSKGNINQFRSQAIIFDLSFQSDIVHRDLKTSNVLLTKDWNVKLCDLGLAREVADKMSLAGYTDFTAPEVLKAEDKIISGEMDIKDLPAFGLPLDVYSFGTSPHFLSHPPPSPNLPS